MNDLPLRRPTPSLVRQVNADALKVVHRLSRNGFKALLVGGCVRDLLLGREPKDFDVATDATPRQVRRLFSNCRVVGRRFRIAHVVFGDHIIEVSTFRAMANDEDDENGEPPADAAVQRPPRIVKSDEGMLLRDNLFGTPEEDMRRRDFTVNALAYDAERKEVIDYVGGMDDLEKGVIRMIGDPLTRFTEDPVRMLRAVRFSAVLGFDIEDDTWSAVRELHSRIAGSSPPRLFDEINKMFLSGAASRIYSLLRSSGLFGDLFPPVDAWLGTESGGFPHTSMGAALAAVDERIAGKETVDPATVYCLMFGPLIEERAAQIRQTEGVPPQDAVHRAVDGVFSELGATVRFTNKVIFPTTAIIASQGRFMRMPGKRVQSFISRPFFSAALEYLRFMAPLRGQTTEVYDWWRAYVAGAGQSVPAVIPSDMAGGGKRRRRRRRKRGSANPEAGGVPPTGNRHDTCE